MDVLLEFNSVSVTYKKKQVINNLSFSLKKGEVIALLGPSGCGKTTILNITSGLLKESGGTVKVNTKDFGYVFQEPRLLHWKTVLDNVLFVIKETDKEKRLQKAIHVLKRVGLHEVIHHYPSQLSGGMKQRVSIARALASDPKVILMDEPFSALDPELKSELQADVIELIDEHQLGVIYVTHDPLEAVKLADRILIFSCQGCSLKCEMQVQKKRKERDYQFLKQTEYEIRQWVGGLDHVKSI